MTEQTTARHLNDDVLAEHAAWVRELEAERVTHSNESMKELMSRLHRERPENPYQRHLKTVHAKRKAEAEIARLVKAEAKQAKGATA